MTPEQAVKIGQSVIDEGLTEGQAFRQARMGGLDVSQADTRRAVYERARAANPFTAAIYGLGNSAIYGDGRAVERPAEEQFAAITSRVAGSPEAPAANPFDVASHRLRFDKLAPEKQAAIKSLAGENFERQAEVWAAVAPTWGGQ